jgi:glyceraldehyde 3-phosphate dehydrogenase
VNIGINGFGRIGRLILRSALTDKKNLVNVKAINNVSSLDYMIYKIKYDTMHGTYTGKITKTDDGIEVDGHRIKVFADKDAAALKWGDAGVDYVAECTGIYTTKEKAGLHLKGGAKKVIISAPPKDDTPLYVMGVNHHEYKSDQNVVSNASCTTNGLAPIVKVLNDNWGIKEGLMTTIHAMTIN